MTAALVPHPTCRRGFKYTVLVSFATSSQCTSSWESSVCCSIRATDISLAWLLAPGAPASCSTRATYRGRAIRPTGGTLSRPTTVTGVPWDSLATSSTFSVPSMLRRHTMQSTTPVPSSTAKRTAYCIVRDRHRAPLRPGKHAPNDAFSTTPTTRPATTQRLTGCPYKQWLLCTLRKDVSARIWATQSFTWDCSRRDAARV